MATYTSVQAGNSRPMPTPDQPGELYSIRGEIDLATGSATGGVITLGANDVLELVRLPVAAKIVDWIIDIDQIDSNGTPTLTASVGFTRDWLNAATGANVTATFAELQAVGAIGRTAGGSVVRPTLPASFRLAPVDNTGERYIGLKIGAAAATQVNGKIGFSIVYRGASYGA